MKGNQIFLFFSLPCQQKTVRKTSFEPKIFGIGEVTKLYFIQIDAGRDCRIWGGGGKGWVKLKMG